MKQAPIPENDEARLEALHEYEMLAHSPESWFDHMASAVRELCQAPIALVSLVDRDEQLLKATSGLPCEVKSGSRAESFCGHAILEDGIFEIPDTTEDVRFRDNPAVTGDLGIRFYAGAPLVTSDGYALGTLCVMDHKPRRLSEGQRAALASLAEVAIQYMEARRSTIFANHLERLLDTSDDFVAVVDAATLQLLHANKQLYDLVDTAVDCSELTQLSATDLFPSLSGEFLKGLDTDDSDRAGTTDLPSVPIVSPGEARNQVRLRITPSKVRERSVLLLVANDRSAVLDSLRQAQLAREEAKKLGMVARLTQNPVIITDPQGTIEWANPSFERLTGYCLDNVTGKRPGDFLQGADTDAEARRRIAVALDEGEPVREMILNYDLSGRSYWLDLDIQPVHDDQGKLKHFVSVQTDITDLKQTEERQREARRAAEKANASKMAFLANVSHELRTPLNGIIGIAEILARNPERSDLPEQLVTLRETADGLLRLINKLLDFSQIEAESMTISPHPFSLAQLLRNLDQMLRPATNRKGIGLSIGADINIPDSLRGDSLRLSQLLTNLLNNAIKFTDTGSVRLSVEAPSGSNESVQIVFRVSDTGPGMSDSVQARIFEPFHQADESIVRQHGGTGLGLAICQRLVHLMDGSITLDSQVGEGTTFTVSLPLETASQAEVATLVADAEPTLSLAGQDYRVLLVEDNELNRQVAIAMLDEMGIETVGCETGTQGLDAFRNDAFDLVLVDIQMPDMSGYEVVEQMRTMEAERSNRTPMLAVTAHSLASLDARSRAFDALVGKPLTFEGLQNAIKGWLTAAGKSASTSEVYRSPRDSSEAESNPDIEDRLIEKALVESNLNGDARLVQTLTDLFERQHGHYLEMIDDAIQSDNMNALSDAAHKLKGAVGYFNQSELWQDVAELEKVAGEEATEKTAARVSQIRGHVLTLAEEVRRFSAS